MRLYHYTHRPGATGIFKSGHIDPGVAPGRDRPIQSFAVSLTSDVSGVGHGLPDGRAITQEQAHKLGAYTESELGIKCVDHTKYRLAVEIADDPALVSFLDLYGNDEAFVLATDMSAHSPTDIHVSTARIIELLQMFERDPKMRKSPTWWFYKGKLPVNWVVEVGIWSGVDYLVTSPSEFTTFLRETAKSS